jgi:hypothetical protein
MKILLWIIFGILLLAAFICGLIGQTLLKEPMNNWDRRQWQVAIGSLVGGLLCVIGALALIEPISK